MMDYRHNGGNNNNGSGRFTPQKVSRRRCRSECLQSAPPLQIVPERFQLKHNTEHYAIKSAQQNLRNSYTIKTSHHLKANSVTASPTISTNNTTITDYHHHPNTLSSSSSPVKPLSTSSGDFLPRVRDCAKENLTNGHQAHIIDIKETYLREMDMYKERLRQSTTTNSPQQVAQQQQQIQTQQKLNEGHFNPRNSIFDANRRRIRARSESEPHELYSVSHNLRNSGNHQRDFVS